MTFNFLKFYKRSFVLQWLILFSLSAVVIIGLSAYYYYSIQKIEYLRLSTHESNILKIAKTAIEQSLESVEKDLNYLANNQDFKSTIHTPSQEDTERFSQECQLFAFYAKVYDQIRWIDEMGTERIRIDYHQEYPIIKTFQELQNKSNRYYFLETMELSAGKIHYSPFDLNIENGKIEFPYKPMIRISTPIFDKNNKRRGIFIINYLGSELLGKFSLNTSSSHGESMLLNQEGYWLSAPKEEDAWGFMFQNTEANMALRHSLAWKKILQKTSGQFQNDEGLWSFETVNPLLNATILEESSTDEKEQKYYFKAVTFIPNKVLDAQKEKLLLPILPITGFLLFLASLINFVIIHYRRKESETQQRLLQSYAVIQQMNDPVMITDHGGIITFVNPAAEILAGYTAQELLGKSPNVFKSGKHSKKEYQTLWKTIVSGKVFRGTVINKRKNGELYHEDKTITPIKNEIGEIIGFVSTGKDVTETSLHNKKIEYIAQTDLLTGIHNRYQLQKLYLIELERAQRYSLPFSMILIDIDNFKNINDTYGHDAGDKVLQHLAHVIQKNLRNIDIFARWGGEEFLVLSPNADLNAAKTIAEKLCTVVAKFSFPDVRPVTISLGISTFQDDDSFDSMFKRADSGLYDAKEHGKNRVGEVKND
jgi:diguanylate cyclase (GGDEF)-like protein/PAS domain S-box-containing protein